MKKYVVAYSTDGDVIMKQVMAYNEAEALMRIEELKDMISDELKCSDALDIELIFEELADNDCIANVLQVT